ncbi:hypothetical protein BDZ89DRAFT_1037568 [Hymenopellis radicata]|nr:hypothetical protein BDZ89DRAFT_1037568 [Hymenopellis radicata]
MSSRENALEPNIESADGGSDDFALSSAETALLLRAITAEEEEEAAAAADATTAMAGALTSGRDLIAELINHQLLSRLLRHLYLSGFSSAATCSTLTAHWPSSFQIFEICTVFIKLPKVFNCNFARCGKAFSIVARDPSLDIGTRSFCAMAWRFESLRPFGWTHQYGTIDDLYGGGYDLMDLVTILGESLLHPRPNFLASRYFIQ